ncbi:MAG: efflux RND transporter periplasmic adaptor subunit [Alphaproteobacteria bacterium]|nr:efflux RND transporter periplasmic adaptor subunit [Alphaproteobacteria bacterium]
MKLTKLQQGSLPKTITANGSVQADPSARHTVMAPLSAVIGEIYVRTGQEVAGGAPLVRLGPTPQGAAAYTQAQSALQAATQLVERTRTMLGQRLATAQQLADAVKSQADARATLSELNVEGAGGPQILRAPFPAIVAAVSTSPGAVVAQGAALLDLNRPDALMLELGVVPEQAGAIRVGDAVNTAAFGKQPVPGKVVLCGRLVDPRTGLVPVDVTLPPGQFLAGEAVQADIVTGEAHGYVVPHEAILVNDSGDPYIVQAVEMVAKKVPVRVLATRGAQDVIDGPIDTASPLVLAGNHQLDNGMRVRLAGPDGASAQ